MEKFRRLLIRTGVIVLSGFVAHYFELLGKLANAIHLG